AMHEFLPPETGQHGEQASNEDTSRNAALPSYVADDFQNGTHTHIVLDSTGWNEQLDVSALEASLPVVKSQVTQLSSAAPVVAPTPAPSVLQMPPSVNTMS